MVAIVRSQRATLIVGSLILLGWAAPLMAERPSAPKLLPKKTLAYVRVADSRELVEKFKETAVGRLSQDEKIKPLIMQLYGSAAQAFTRVQDQIGVSLEQILALPQGEMCVAVVGREEGPPAVVVLLEVGEQMPVARKLLERGEQQAISDGATKRTEQLDGITLNVIERNTPAAYCDRDGVVLFASDVEVLKQVLQTWNDNEASDTLADNRQFTAIMSRSVGTKDERPQVTWFVDPMELFTNLSRDNLGAQATLALLPTIGLDGIKAAGGSFIFATEEFDSISHMHLMLDNPREGVLRMLAIESGDTTPEAWVPYDAASYMTVYWNAEQTLTEFRKIFDMIRGEGALDAALKQRFSDRLGVDVEKDIIGQVAGRLTHVSWFQKPARVNSGTNLVGIELQDAAAFRKSLETMIGRAGDRIPKKTYRGIRYYQFTPRRQPPNVDESLVRRPTPCVAVVGDFLLGSDSEDCLKAAIDNKNDPSKSLADELDFKLIASRVRQYLGSTKPGMVAFQRPEESMRSFYELATSPTTRRRLSEAADRNPAFRALDQALKDNPLPPFSVIAKYLAPGGGMLVSDQSGIHYTTFALKRE